MGVLGGETQGAQGHKGDHGTAHRTVTDFGHRHTCPQKGRGKLLTFGIPVELLCFGHQHRLTCWVGGSGRGRSLGLGCPTPAFPDPLPPRPGHQHQDPSALPQPCSGETRVGWGHQKIRLPAPLLPLTLSRAWMRREGSYSRRAPPPSRPGHHFWNMPVPGLLGGSSPLPPPPPRSALHGLGVNHTLRSLSWAQLFCGQSHQPLRPSSA